MRLNYGIVMEIETLLDTTCTTRAELARIMGVSRSQITQWLAPHGNMTADVADRITRTLGVEFVVSVRAVERCTICGA